MSTPDVVHDIVDQHAIEAAFNWVRRAEAATSPAYDLLELCELDDRLSNHLDGLREAGNVGWGACEELLEAEEPGSIFGATVLALEREDWPSFARLLDRTAEASSDGGGTRELISALGWLPFERVQPVLAGMRDGPAALQRIGVAVHALHRRDPGVGLASAAEAADAALSARALRALGELRRRGSGSDLEVLRAAWRGQQDSPDDARRFWAAWSAVLLGDRDATTVLLELSARSALFGRRACDLLVRVQGPAALTTLQTLAAQSELGLRHALFGAGALGDPAMVPWLLTFVDHDTHARPAAWSLALMLNLDLTGERAAKAPAGFNAGPNEDPLAEDVAPDPDEDLPWPAAQAVRDWWKRQSKEFASGTRYLLGRPIERPWLEHVLARANQVARAGAALELALRRDQPLFEVRAPGFAQLTMLGLV